MLGSLHQNVIRAGPAFVFAVVFAIAFVGALNASIETLLGLTTRCMGRATIGYCVVSCCDHGAVSDSWLTSWYELILALLFS